MTKNIPYFLALIFFTVSVSFAHGGLELSSKEEIIETQKMLVKEGLLKVETGFKYGTVDLYTDDAYDKYIVRKRIKEFEKERAERASTTPVVETKVEEKTFWQKLILFIKFW
jgi:hypothetical protein